MKLVRYDLIHTLPPQCVFAKPLTAGVEMINQVLNETQ